MTTAVGAGPALGADDHGGQRVWWLPWLTVLGVLASLEALSRSGAIPQDHLPAVTTVLTALGAELRNPTFWLRVWETVQAWGLGLAVAVVAGIPLGLAIGSNRLAYRIVRVLIEFVRPIPPVAVLPLAVLLFGTGVEMKVYLVAFAAFFPLLFQALYGVQDVDPVARDTARAYGLGPAGCFVWVTVPSALPYVATGLRLSAAIALIVTIATEIVVGSSGLGYAINEVRYASDIALMYGIILVTGVLGLAIAIVFRQLERRLLHWHASQRQGMAA
ncbi:MAG: ABC transporter permease [Euzebyaceae bacterium]|jgi:ABC-type nitrate/sulfonate/bicarbonate transport system permease component|nr:ABC transporter permease [Euzebyaceae bacterium]